MSYLGLVSRNVRNVASLSRWCRFSTVAQLTEGEKKILETLTQKFPEASAINVEDISGGCGSMYNIQVESIEFKGKRLVMQHRMVNEALKEAIKDMHGLRITTSTPT